MNDTLSSVRRWFPIAFAIVVVDQLTKHWALSALADGRIIDLIGSSRLILSFNTGIAFGQGRGRGLGPIIAAVGLVVVVGLVTSIGRRSGRAAQYAVGLIVGGAIGNVIDRLTQPPGWLRGGVVDFIQVFRWFPIFNVADVAITLGGLGLVIVMMRQQRRADSDAIAPELDGHLAASESDRSEPGEPESGDGTDTGKPSTGKRSAGKPSTGKPSAGKPSAGAGARTADAAPRSATN